MFIWACSPITKLILGTLICTTTCPAVFGTLVPGKRTYSKMKKDRVPCRKFYLGGAIMDKIYDKCCGIDVHKKLIVACFRCGKRQEVREFGATTRELLALADWLREGGCEMVAMGSTASYWKPLYNILESSDLKAMVVNARHMKAVPGRKTDVKDAEWIADLLQHGLLQPSFIPDKDQRELRELVRYRKSLVGERTRELNRLQKNAGRSQYQVVRNRIRYQWEECPQYIGISSY